MSIFIVPILFFALSFGVAIFLYQHSVDDWKNRKRDYQGLPNHYPDPGEMPSMSLVRPAVIAAVLSGLFIAFAALIVVPAGHIGVQVTLGTVNQTTLEEGVHFVNPISSVKDVDVRLVTATLTGSSAGTKDLQQVHTDIVLNYRLNGDKVAHIYKEFGLDLEDRIVKPALNESFKAVTAQYSSEELITKRDEVSTKIKQEVGEKLGKYNVIVGDISLVNFGFSAQYQAAIEAKVIATQSKLKAEQDLSRIQVEAQQEIAKAEGRAKAIQIETQAINSQGGASYVQLKAIEKWNGKLPDTMAGQSTPFINLK